MISLKTLRAIKLKYRSMRAGTTSARPKQDVQLLRADTPGVSRVVHFNNAGCSLPPKQVTNEVRRFLHAEEHFGGYEAAEYYADSLQRPYSACADLLGCGANEIAVVQSATQAWQQVFFGMHFNEGDRVITSVAEYGTNYVGYLQMQKRSGIRIETINETRDGDVDLEHLEELVTVGDLPKLISISHVPTSSGRVYNAKGIGQIANAHGILFLLDACQSVGQMPINVKEIGCDFLSGTSRKYLRGPRGIGFLYANQDSVQSFEPMALDEGAIWSTLNDYTLLPNGRRYEPYELNFAAKAGFGVAVEMARDLGIEWIWTRIQMLGKKLREVLADICKIKVHDRGHVLCGIVSFSVEGMESHEVKARLRTMGVNVSVSSIGSTRLDFEKRNLSSVVRASVHYYNTDKEIYNLASALEEIAGA